MKAQRTRNRLTVFRSGNLAESVSVEARLPQRGNHRVSAPANRQGGDRLDSWKQIAVYLDREVRTVQRWEKNEGLPVHRHIHLKGGTVYGLKEEIDVWLTGRGQTPSKCCPLQRRSRQAAKGLNPSSRVIRQLLSAFGLWLAVVARDSDQDSDGLAVPAARMAHRDSYSFTQRPQSKLKVRARQLVTCRVSRLLSLAYLRQGVKIQTDHELHQLGKGNTEPDIYWSWSGPEGLV